MKNINSFKIKISVVILLIVIAFLFMANDSSRVFASIMRLERADGNVEVRDDKNAVIDVNNGMRLFDGNKVKTAAESYAYISLDETKAVKLDMLSEIELSKSGGNLELNLIEGEMFFNVTSPLTSAENMDIRTSTMVTSIRGTAGYLKVVSDTVSYFTLIDGQAVITASHTDRDEIETKEIFAGQIAKIDVLADEGEQVIQLVDLTADDVPGFVLKEMVDNPQLQSDVIANTNLNFTVVMKNVDQIVEEEAKIKLDSVNNNIGNNSSDDDDDDDDDDEDDYDEDEEDEDND